MGRWREHNYDAKWVVALGRLSHTWFRENLSEGQFFARWKEMLDEGRSNTKLQRKIIYDSDRDAGRLANRIAYRKYADRRRAEAREYRRVINDDPVKRADRNARDRIRKKRRRDTDINCRLGYRLRTRIFMALRRYDKAFGTAQLIGCSIEECRKYLESLWKPGMSWTNHNRHGWHIDHIRPCTSFDLTDPEQQRACFHFSNLQPLWSDQNWQKGGKIL